MGKPFGKALKGILGFAATILVPAFSKMGYLELIVEPWKSQYEEAVFPIAVAGFALAYLAYARRSAARTVKWTLGMVMGLLANLAGLLAFKAIWSSSWRGEEIEVLAFIASWQFFYVTFFILYAAIFGGLTALANKGDRGVVR